MRVLKLCFVLIITAIFFSCESTIKEIDKSECNAFQDNSGLYVFIMSEPKREIAERYPTITRNLINEKITEIKKMKPLQLVTGIPNALNDISFDRQINEMIQLVKTNYPQADGVIFKKLDECTPIRFK